MSAIFWGSMTSRALPVAAKGPVPARMMSSELESSVAEKPERIGPRPSTRARLAHLLQHLFHELGRGLDAVQLGGASEQELDTVPAFEQELDGVRQP